MVTSIISTDNVDGNKGRRVRCVICGEIFDASLDTCPVCGADRSAFEDVEDEDTSYSNDTNEIFLILGSGAAALNAAAAIRERNKTAAVVMLSDENSLPYQRPMLTKALSTKLSAEALAIKDEAWYEENNILCYTDKHIISLDTKEQLVTCSDNTKFAYNKCIYALGARSFVPPIKGSELTGVYTIRTIQDAEAIYSAIARGNIKSAAVIGGGVLGLEAAWELHNMSCNVTVIETAPTLMPRQLDSSASDMLCDIARDNGVTIITGAQVESIISDESADTVAGVRLAKPTDEKGNIVTIPAEIVIISCGITPNTETARSAGIDCGRSVKVNANMQTNIPNVYACGDCAEYEGINYALWSQAIDMGSVAGANAAGEQIVYELKAPILYYNGMTITLQAEGDTGKNPDKQYTVSENRTSSHSLEKKYLVDGKEVGRITIK